MTVVTAGDIGDLLIELIERSEWYLERPERINVLMYDRFDGWLPGEWWKVVDYVILSLTIKNAEARLPEVGGAEVFRGENEA